MRLGWSLIFLFLVLFAEFQSGFLKLHWLENQSRFVADVGLVDIECDLPLGVCLLGDCVDLLVVLFDFIWNLKNDINEEIVFV